MVSLIICVALTSTSVSLSCAMYAPSEMRATASVPRTPTAMAAPTPVLPLGVAAPESAVST